MSAPSILLVAVAAAAMDPQSDCWSPPVEFQRLRARWTVPVMVLLLLLRLGMVQISDVDEAKQSLKCYLPLFWVDYCCCCSFETMEEIRSVKEIFLDAWSRCFPKLLLLRLALLLV